jgi:hypothetical protein
VGSRFALVAGTRVPCQRDFLIFRYYPKSWQWPVYQGALNPR